MRKLSWLSFLSLLPAFFLGTQTLPAALVDTWRADDLSVLNDGDAVGSWSSASNRTLTAGVGLQPLLKKNVTPAAGAAVRFNLDFLNMSANSPVGGLTNFAIALVFKAGAVGGNYGSQWYNKSGIVDAEEAGVTADWGTVIDETGRIGLGIGNPDNTVYSEASPSLVDNNYHAAVFTWGGGVQGVYVDNLWANTTTGASTGPRNDAGFSIGGTHTGANGPGQRFVGDLVELRFYNTNFSLTQITNLIQELTDLHITPNQPIIRSFIASTNQIWIGTAVTLSWVVTNASAILIDQGIGLVPGASGSIQVFPRSNTTYTLTSTNSFGVRTAQVTVLVNQGIPVANNQSVSVTLNTPAAIMLTGSDPQGSNLTYAVVAAPWHGTLAGPPPALTYTPTTNFIGNDEFTFKVNDGEFDSPPATVSIQVLAPPTAPSAIVLSTTNISPSAGPGSFIASLRALDINPGDTHTFTLVPGFGDNARFVLVGNQLTAGSTFAGGLGASFAIRVRATDNTGLWVEQTLSLHVTALTQGIVINEIHYNPPDNTVFEQFIELHNPTAADVDMSLWQITGGVQYTLPPESVIAPGGFLVLAQDPPTMLSRFGVTALGPWTGSLSSQGETVTVQDGNGKKVNEVSYSSEFPWPIGADGGGGSMALVNPALDNNLGSSWRTETPPSPGRANQVFTTNAAPNIRQVKATPNSPTSTNQVVITAKVTDPEGVASVQLLYQIVTPGNYIPAVLPVPLSQLNANPSLLPTPNPDFENPAHWITVPMVDTGTAGDAQAGDGIYTAVLPPQANRVLVRYRIAVTDSLGASRRAPFEDDPSLNFAYFVYDGIPAYQGISAQTLQSLPVYFLISRPQDITQCTAYNGTYQIPQFASSGLANLARYVFNWPGTLLYDGVVYDNICYRLHGANGRYQPGKRNWRFELNKGNYLQAKDQNGQPYPRKWKHLTTGKGSSNRLLPTFSLNETLNYFLYNKVGVPAPYTFFFHFRVVQGAQEAPGQYTGDFWGLNWAQEDYDAGFLDAHNMDKGNLYKLINASFSTDPAQDMLGQQRYQGPFAVTNGTDGTAIQSGLLRAQTSGWIRAHVNLPEWYHYHAIVEGIRNYDFWPDANKNAAWYFAPPYSPANNNYGSFWTMPFDTDDTWGPTWNAGQDLVYNGVFLAASHPDLQIEYANVVREVRDLLFQPDQINPLIDAFALTIHDFVPADLLRWSHAPSSAGSYADLTAQSGFVSPVMSGGLAAYVQDLKNFLFVGGTHTWWIDRQTVAAGGWVTRLDSLAADSAIPTKPTISYAGPTNFPVTGLFFRSSAFADPQGANTFAAMQWRVAEVTPTNAVVTNVTQLKQEWDAVWDSGEMTLFTNQIQVPAVATVPGHFYRARVRHKDNTGRWSNWSAPLVFTPSAVDIVSVLQQSLVVSEIMYNPPSFSNVDGSELEFLELQNIGTNVLDLSGLTFTSGIHFTFTNGTTLGPGRYFLLGRNATALQAKYPGLVINGIYTGKLSNSGDTLTLTHPYGINIFSITYGTRAPWPVTPDGYGFSLVLDEANPGHYRASSEIGGSPGAADPVSNIPGIVVNEILSRPLPPALDTIELHNPGTTNVNIGGWFLTDDANYPWKYAIPDPTILRAGCYALFSETQFNPTPGIGASFGLSSLGEEVYLFSADAAHNLSGYSHGFAFEGSAPGQTYGRFINSAGEEQFPPQIASTLGTNNLGPAIGPVVISEINYLPAPSGTEFLELRNITSAAVPLYDPDHPTNVWKVSGIGFTFLAGISIPPGGFLLLVASDPVTFRTQQGVSNSVQIFQYSGQLQPNGEMLELLRPDLPETNGVPYVPVDQVNYGAASPWPVAAAGASLQRIDAVAYGNDPSNWQAAPPTPGTSLPTPVPLITLQVKVDPADLHPDLSFNAQANRPYTVQYKGSLADSSWLPLVTVPMLAANRTVTINDASAGSTRFYRVVTPGLP
jgi:hypothetical protein